MSCVAAFPLCSSLKSLSPWKGSMLNAAKTRQCPATGVDTSRTQPLIVKAHVSTPTFSSRISTDIPFDEAPEASFARYLEDKPRVFGAIFPEKQASQQLNEEEWRIHMLPVDNPFLTICPVVDMRLKCNSNMSEYPSGVPHYVPKVLQLEIIRSELQGLDVLKHTQFFLGLKGTMYCDSQGPESRLKGEMQLSISIVLPPMLAFLSGDVCRDATESILRRMTENMKHRVNASLLSDYREFKRETLKDLA